MSQETFAALGVSAELAAALGARGIDIPFQIQSRAIPPALAGTDLLASPRPGRARRSRSRSRSSSGCPSTTRARPPSSSSRRASSPSR